MNTLQNTSEAPENPSRRFFLGASVALATATLVGCNNSHFPQEDQVKLNSMDEKDKDLIIKTALYENLEKMYLYFRFIHQDFETIDGIRTAKIQNGKNTLNIQIGNGFLMGSDCLLILGNIDSMNVDIIYKDGIVKSRKRSMNYRELNDVMLWANNNINKS